MNFLCTFLENLGFECYLSCLESNYHETKAGQHKAIYTGKPGSEYDLQVVDIWEDGSFECYAQRKGIEVTIKDQIEKALIAA